MRLTIVVGLSLSSARARAEPPENKCPQKLLADGRVVREGTCHAKIVFDSGVFNLYLEDGSIIIDDVLQNIEVEYGAVHAMANSVEPDIIVRRGEHFGRTVVGDETDIWVYASDSDTEVSLLTSSGETLVTTSWRDEFALREGDSYIVSLAPDEGGEMICALKVSNGSSPPEGKLLLVVGALALWLRRRRRRT